MPARNQAEPEDSPRRSYVVAGQTIAKTARDRPLCGGNGIGNLATSREVLKYSPPPT